MLVVSRQICIVIEGKYSLFGAAGFADELADNGTGFLILGNLILNFGWGIGLEIFNLPCFLGPCS